MQRTLEASLAVKTTKP